MVRKKLYSSFSLFMAYKNVAWFSLILQRNVTFPISSAQAQLVLYEFVCIGTSHFYNLKFYRETNEQGNEV